MSAIVGVVERRGLPVEPAIFDRMIAAIEHRGPDGIAAWREGSLALAHLRFSLGESPDAQPVIRRRGEHRVVLVADARLDEVDELRAALAEAAEGAESDAELILAAYTRWGLDCLARLVGDFAFAIWDESQRRLFCARDAIGARPLYYHLAGERFVFGTEVTAVAAHRAVPDDVDDERVADFLGQIFADRSRTFFRGIRRLPPGWALEVDESGERHFRHWSLDPAARVEMAGDDAYAGRFRELFGNALKARMGVSRRIGILLSGGLDSSSMVCLARQRLGEWSPPPLTVLSARFPDFPYIDEGSFLEEVRSGGELDAHEISASAITPLGEAAEMLQVNGQPFGGPNLYIHRALAQRARELGVSVLLDGVDGDTTVAHGVEWIGELLRRGRVVRALTEARGCARRFRRRPAQFLWHFGIKPAFVLPVRHRIAACFGRETPRPPSTASGDLLARVGWHARLRDMLGDRLAPAVRLHDVHLRALTSDLVSHFLEVDDAASAAFGIESRHPYFDRRLVEFCFALPAEQRLCGGWDRVVQRRAMAGIPPERVRWRTDKSNWGDQFKAGFLNGDRDLIEDVLARPDRLGDYVDVRQLAMTWERCSTNTGTDDDKMNLWLGVQLGLWLRSRRKWRADD